MSKGIVTPQDCPGDKSDNRNSNNDWNKYAVTIMEKKVKIKEIIRETKDVITVEFDNDPIFYDYAPGQFINITKEISGETISRSYSFSSSPFVDQFPSVTIKKVRGGKFSEKFIKSTKEGDEILISQPTGRFGIDMDELDGKHLIFIAGGSGITPLFSMIKTVLHQSREVKVTLLFANKDVPSVIFYNQLDRLSRFFNKELNTIHFVEELPDKHINESHVKYRKGYVTRSDILDVLGFYPELHNEVYLCGPSAMMEAIHLILDDLGFDKKYLHTESFGLCTPLVQGNENSSNVESLITIEKEGELIEFTANQNDSILNAALSLGIKLPHSCKEAMCGTCKAKILRGNVNMTENYALTDSQLKEGYVLLCSGKPDSDKVELTYK